VSMAERRMGINQAGRRGTGPASTDQIRSPKASIWCGLRRPWRAVTGIPRARRAVRLTRNTGAAELAHAAWEVCYQTFDWGPRCRTIGTDAQRGEAVRVDGRLTASE